MEATTATRPGTGISPGRCRIYITAVNDVAIQKGTEPFSDDELNAILGGTASQVIQDRDVMVTVDCHLHLGLMPEQVPEWWLREQFEGWAGSVSGDDIVEVLDHAEIDIGLVQGGDIRRTTYDPRYPDDHYVYTSNDYVAEQCSRHPGRLYGVVCLDPLRDIQAALQEIERCVTELDFRLLKLIPTYHHYSPDDYRMDPIYAKCVELDLPVMIHMGWTRTINAPMEHQRPVQLDRIGRHFRSLKVIMAHLGHPWVDEGIAVVAKHPNFYCELAGWTMHGPEAVYEALAKLKGYGAIDRVLYGSDNGDTKSLYQEANRIALERDGKPVLDEQEMNDLLGETAARLFSLPDT